MGELAWGFDYGLNAAAVAYDGKHKYLRITDIDDQSHRFNQSKLTSPNTDLNLQDSYRLNEGDIVFARTGASVGKTYKYDRSDGLVYFAGFLIMITVHDDVDANFIYQQTLTDQYDNFIGITSQRSGQPGVNANEYKNFRIFVPSKKEQVSIGRLLIILDNLITVNQRKSINQTL